MYVYMLIFYSKAVYWGIALLVPHHFILLAAVTIGLCTYLIKMHLYFIFFYGQIFVHMIFIWCMGDRTYEMVYLMVN